MRLRLLTIVAVTSLATPLTGIAQSYLTPEEVLQQNDGAFLVPSHQRGARWASDLEAQLSRDRHPSIIREPWDPVQDDGLPPPIATDERESLLPSTATNPYPGLDPVTARLLVRLTQDNRVLQSQLASGVPLADTGPAATVSVVAMLIAILWTLRRARALEKFVRGIC